MRDFTELTAWQRAIDLTEELYRSTSGFPRSEARGLVDQIRRSVGSIGANLAEGAGRPSNTDFRRFVGYSLGSLNELEHHCIVAQRVGFLGPQHAVAVLREIGEIRAMTVALRRSLAKRET
ncbi:MAG: four helix bundle protein [Acidimicrobiia bacterium]|nr:four helix bundle protein [Acidimicrobiia bacterium]